MFLNTVVQIKINHDDFLMRSKIYIIKTDFTVSIIHDKKSGDVYE